LIAFSDSGASENMSNTKHSSASSGSKKLKPKNLNITHLNLDFEYSAHEAARHFWPDVTIKGCQFHLAHRFGRHEVYITDQNNAQYWNVPSPKI
jgi:hypothetical protein